MNCSSIGLAKIIEQSLHCTTVKSPFVKSRAWVSGFATQIPLPDKGGWIDLRVTAKDAAGNTFSQEITKAFEATPAKSGSSHWWCGHGHISDKWC